ncbi:hypothetical protein [Lederbergia panacisoli]|uniref:hypothetical protein n=1 Tax=Lederbergia panacisoli TaxID=1255251 RepID=UPI00214B0DD0|nr:hypothetical protein [Lederbergia panacisoli]MCR2820039.1 hypothetical protein [Lederbergia panacisoli]
MLQKFKREFQELTLFPFEQLEKENIGFKIHTGESNHRFVLWANKDFERNRYRDFLTIFTRKTGLLLRPKFCGIGWKSDEALKCRKKINHHIQIDEEFLGSIKKAYISISEKDSF